MVLFDAMEVVFTAGDDTKEVIKINSFHQLPQVIAAIKQRKLVQIRFTQGGIYENKN